MRRSALIYLSVTLFCGLFSAVYEHFSFGVISNYMVYLFVFPFLGGVLPYTILGLIPGAPCATDAASRVYNSGIAALAAGSCIRGVLDIYGTSSVYLPVYWLSGVLLIIAGLELYFIGARKVSRASK